MIDEKEVIYHPRQKKKTSVINDTERKINKIIKYSDDVYVLNTYIFETLHDKFVKTHEKQNKLCGKETISIVITQKNMQQRKQKKLTVRKSGNEMIPITTGEYLKIMAKNGSAPDVHKVCTNRKQKKKTFCSDTCLNKSTSFNTKYIVNAVALEPHTIPLQCQDLLKHPLMQAQMRIYRCQLGSQEAKYCQACDSDAFFDVLKGLYDCYIKKNCDNCNCILCSSFHKAKRKLLLGEASRSKVSVGVETVSTKRKAKETLKRSKDYGLFTSLIAKPTEQTETKITARSKEPLSTQLEKLRKAQESGFLPTLEGHRSIQREKTSNALVQSASPLNVKKKIPDNKVINQVRKELGLPLESKPMSEDERYTKVKALGHIGPFEKKIQKETILRAEAEKRVIVSPEARPTLELKRKPLETRAQSKKQRKGRAACLLTSNVTHEQKEMEPGIEQHRICLAEGKTILERKLIDKIRKELCLTTPIAKTALERITKPILSRGHLLGSSPVTIERKRKLGDKTPKVMKDGKGDLRICSLLTSLSNRKAESKSVSPCKITFETVRAAETAGLFSKLQGKTQSEKEKVIRSLANQEIPFPEAKTPSEKKIAKKIRAQLGLPPAPSTKCTQTTKYEKVKAQSLTAYAEGKTNVQMKNNKNNKEASEQNTLSTKEIRRKVKSASVIPALNGEPPEQKALMLRKLKASGLKLTEERIPSEKIPMQRMTISKSKGLVITPERKNQYDKTKMLRRLAKSGLPLPEGRTVSDKELIKKIRTEMVLPLETPSIKGKLSEARATCNRVMTPHGNEISSQAENNIMNRISETRIQLVQCSPSNKTSNSEKSNIRGFRSIKTGTGHVRKPKGVVTSVAAIKEENVEKDNTRGTCEIACGCDKKKIRFKHSYVKIRVTSPDVSSFCSCPHDCPGISNGVFADNKGIKVTVETATGLPSYSYKVQPTAPLKQTLLQYPVSQHSQENLDDLFYSQSHISLEISSVDSDYTTDYSSSTSIVYIYNSESDVSISDIKRMLRESINSGEFDESIQDYRQREKPVSYIYQSRFAISRADVKHDREQTAPELSPVSNSCSGSYYTIETVSSSGETDSDYIRDTFSLLSTLARTLGLSTDSFLVQRSVNEEYHDTENSESLVKDTDLVPVDTLLRNSHYFIDSSQESNDQFKFEKDVAIYRQTLQPFRSKSLKLQQFGGRRATRASMDMVSSTRLMASSSIFVMVSTSGIDQHYSGQYLETVFKSESSHNIISKARAWMDTKKIKLSRFDIFNKKRSYFKKNKQKRSNEGHSIKKNSNACSKAARKNAMKCQASVGKMKEERPSRALSMDTARDRLRYGASDEGYNAELNQSKPNVISEIIKPMIAREEVAQGLVKEAYMKIDYNQTPSSTFYPSDSFGTTRDFVTPVERPRGNMKPTEISQGGYDSLDNQHLNDNVDSTHWNNPVQYSAEQEMLTTNSEISLASTIYSRGCVNPALYTAQRRQTKKCSDDCKSQKSVKKSKSCVCTNSLNTSVVKAPTCATKKRCINKTAESRLAKTQHSRASVDSHNSKILNARDSVTCTKKKKCHHGRKSSLRKGGQSVNNVKSSYVQKNESNESAESARLIKSFSHDSMQYRCASRGSPTGSSESRYAKQHSSRYSPKTGYGKYSSDERPESRYVKKSYSQDGAYHRYKKISSPYDIVISCSPKKCSHYDSMESGQTKKQSYYDSTGLRHRKKNAPLGSLESRCTQKYSPYDSNESRYSRNTSPVASIKSGPRKCCSRHDMEPSYVKKKSLNDDLKIKYKRKYYARDARNSNSNESFDFRTRKRSFSQDSLNYNYAKKHSPFDSITSANARNSYSHDGAEFRKARKYSDDNMKSSYTKKDYAKHHQLKKHSPYDEKCCTGSGGQSGHVHKHSYYDSGGPSNNEKCCTRGGAESRQTKKHSPYDGIPSYDENYYTKSFSPNNSVKSGDSKKCCSHKGEHSRCTKHHSLTKQYSPSNTAHHDLKHHCPDCNVKSSHARPPSQSSLKSSAGKCHPCDNPQHNDMDSSYPKKYYSKDSVISGKACSHENVAPCHLRKCSHHDNVDSCFPKKCPHHEKVEPCSLGKKSRRDTVEPYCEKADPSYPKKCSHHDAGKPCCQKTCSHQESRRSCCQKQRSHHDAQEHKPPKTCSHHDVEKPLCQETCSYHDTKNACSKNRSSQDMRPPCCQKKCPHESPKKRNCSHHKIGQPCCQKECSHQDVGKTCCQKKCSHHYNEKAVSQNKCSHHDMGQTCCQKQCSHEDTGKSCCQKKCPYHDNAEHNKKKKEPDRTASAECCHNKKPDRTASAERCQNRQTDRKAGAKCCHRKKPARSVSADSCFPKKRTKRESIESSTTKECRRVDSEDSTDSCDSKIEESMEPCAPKSCLQTKRSKERRKSNEALEACACPKKCPKSSKPRKSVFQRLMASMGGTSSKENVSTTCPKRAPQCSSQNRSRRDSMSGRDSVTSHKDSMTSTHYIDKCGKRRKECNQRDTCCSSGPSERKTEGMSPLCKKPVCPGSNPCADKSLSPINIVPEVCTEKKEPEKTEKIPEKLTKKEEVKEKKVKKPKQKKEEKYECKCPLTNIIGKGNADDEVIDDIDTCCTTRRHEPSPSCKQDTTDKSCLTKEQNAMLHVLKRVSEYLKATGSIGECHCETKAAHDTETCRKKGPCATKKCYPHSPLPKEREREEYESERRRTSAEPRRRPTLNREREDVDSCRRASCIIRKCNRPHDDKDGRHNPKSDDKCKNLCGRRHTDCRNYLKSRKTKNENEVVTKVTDLTKKTSPCLCNSALFEKMLNKVMKEACFSSPATCGRPHPQTPSQEPSKPDKESVKPVKESPNPAQEPSAGSPSTQESSHPPVKTSPAFTPEERPIGETERSPDLVPQESAAKSSPGTPDVVPNQLPNVVVSHSIVLQSQQTPFLDPKRSSYHFAHQQIIPVSDPAPMLVSELKPADNFQKNPNPALEATAGRITQQNPNVRTEPVADWITQQNLNIPLESNDDRTTHQNLNVSTDPSPGRITQRKHNVALETGPAYIFQHLPQRLTNTAQQTRVAHVYQHFPNNLSYHHFGGFSRHPNRTHVPSDGAQAHYGHANRCEHSENTNQSMVYSPPGEHRIRRNLNSCAACKCEQSKHKQENFNYTFSCSGCEPVVAYNNSASFRPGTLKNIQPDNTSGIVSCSGCDPNIRNTNAPCLDNVCSWDNMQSSNNGQTSNFSVPNDTPNYSKRCSCKCIQSDNSGQTNVYSGGQNLPNVPNGPSQNPPYTPCVHNVSKNNENVCVCKPPPSESKRRTSTTGYARSAPSEPSNNLNSICACKFLQPDDQVNGCENCLREAIRKINSFDPNVDAAKFCSLNNATPGFPKIPERQNASFAPRQQSPCGIRQSPPGGQTQSTCVVPGQQSSCLVPNVNRNNDKACKCDPPINTDSKNNPSSPIKNGPHEPSVRKSCGSSCTACKCHRLESNARTGSNVPENCLTQKPRHCSPCNPNDKSTGTPRLPKLSQIAKKLPRTASGTVICVDRKLCERLIHPCVCGIDACKCYLPDYPIQRDPVSSKCYQRNPQGQTCGARAPIGRCLQREPKQCPLNPLCAQPQRAGPEGTCFQIPQRPAVRPDGQWNDGRPYQMIGPNGQMVGPQGQNLIPHQLTIGGNIPYLQPQGGGRELIQNREQTMVDARGTLNRRYQAEEPNYPTMAPQGQVEDLNYPAMVAQGQMEELNYPLLASEGQIEQHDYPPLAHEGQIEDPNYPVMTLQGQIEDPNYPITGTQGQMENPNNETWGPQEQQEPNYAMVNSQGQNPDMQQGMAGLEENPEVSQVGPDGQVYEARQSEMVGPNEGITQTPTQQQQMVNRYYQMDPAFKGHMKVPYDHILNTQEHLIKLHQQRVSQGQMAQHRHEPQKQFNNVLQTQTPSVQPYIITGASGQLIQNLHGPLRSGTVNRTNESYNLMAGAQGQQQSQQVMHPQGHIVQNLTKTKNEVRQEAKKIRKSLEEDDDAQLENLLQERVERDSQQSEGDNPPQNIELECTCETKLSCFNQKVWNKVSEPCPCGPDPGPLVVIKRPEKTKCSDVILQIKSFFKKKKNEDKRESEKDKKTKSKNKKKEEVEETKKNENETIDKEATGPTVQIIYGPQGHMLGGYSDQRTGGYAEHKSGRYVNPMVGGYPGHSAVGYPGQMVGGYPDQMAEGYPDQMEGGYADEIEGDYRQQMESGYPDVMQGANADEIEHHGQMSGRYYNSDPLDAIIYGPEGKMIGSSLGTMTQVSQDQLRSRYNLLLDTQEQTGSLQWPARNGSQGQVMYHTRGRIGNYPEGQSSYYRWLGSQGQMDFKRSHSGGRITSGGCVSRRCDEDMVRKSQAQSKCSSYERKACSRHQQPFYPYDQAADCPSHRFDDSSWNDISGSCSCRRTDDAKIPCQGTHYYQYLAGPMAADPRTRYTKIPREHILHGNRNDTESRQRLNHHHGRNRGRSQKQSDGIIYQQEAGRQVGHADNTYDIHPTISETRNANPERPGTPPPRTSQAHPMGPRASSPGGSPGPPMGPRALSPRGSKAQPIGPRASSPGGSPGSPMGPRTPSLRGPQLQPMGPGAPSPRGSRVQPMGSGTPLPRGPQVQPMGSRGPPLRAQPIGPRAPSPRGSRMEPMAPGTTLPPKAQDPKTPASKTKPKTAKIQTSDESSDQLGGAMNVYQIDKKQRESEALKSLLMKAAKQGGCSKEMCCSWHDLQKACLRELRAMKSDLAQSTSGFQISQPKRPLVFCTSESSLSDSSEYASEYNPECTRVKPRQDKERPSLKDKFKGGLFKKKGKDKKLEKETTETVSESDNVPEMEQLIVVEDDSFKGLKFFLEGKGVDSPGLSGIFCFNMTQEL